MDPRDDVSRDEGRGAPLVHAPRLDRVVPRVGPVQRSLSIARLECKGACQAGADLDALAGIRRILASGANGRPATRTDGRQLPGTFES